MPVALATPTVADEADALYQAESLLEQMSYTEYAAAHADAPTPTKEIILAAAHYLPDSHTKGELLTDYEGQSGVSLLRHEGETLHWQFAVEETGVYALRVKYYPIAGHGGVIEQRVLIDGQLSFGEAASLGLDRVWTDETTEKVYDNQGNEILSLQKESPIWQTKYLVDDAGLADGAVLFYLTAGSHTVTMVGDTEPVVLHELAFVPAPKADSYTSVSMAYQQAGYSSIKAENALQIEGEDAIRKSDQTMYPQADRSSPLSQPYDHARMVYNTIGSNQWKSAGQWLEWDIDMQESGLCQLALRYKQSLKSGDVSVRSLTIDGEAPFAEAGNLTFAYNSAWKLEYLADDEGQPYQFYLEKGKHTVRLQATLGDGREMLSQAKDCLESLNAIYREIVVVTGASPDIYRDYKLDIRIPDTIASLGTAVQELKALETLVKERNEGGSQNTSDIKRLYKQIEQMLEDTDAIPKRLTTFKNNVSSFGTWINNATAQPLEVDYLLVNPVGAPLGKGEGNMFAMLAHYCKQFFASFSMDYTSIGQIGDGEATSITVWMTSGRDQAQIIKQLINSQFTPEKNISVDLQLVTDGTLLPATLAGIGPDASLGMVQTEPVNMALRKGVMDLTRFADYEQIASEFYDSSIEPFTFNGGVYALPETLTYPMLFYRKDVIEELGIRTDDLATWDGMLGKVLPELRNSSLSFGVLPNINNYLLFLYQNGGELYLENGKKSGLFTGEAIKAMEDYTMLYTQYGLNLSYDFANRFRSGEMPVAIADYTSYNQLTVFAPEIKNLWGMLPVPGSLRADGTVDHTAVSIVTGAVMMTQTSEPEATWEFLKWWTGADVQASYGTLLESVVGSAARYNTANKLAMSTVQWDADVKASLQYQAAHLQARPEVPGGYYTTRLFDFAFRNIVYDDEDVRETLIDTVDDINREIQNKRDEYQLDE